METRVFTEYDRAAVEDVCTLASQFAGWVLNGVGLVRGLMRPPEEPVAAAVAAPDVTPPAPEAVALVPTNNRPQPPRRPRRPARSPAPAPSAVEARARQILATPTTDTARPVSLTPRAPADGKPRTFREVVRAACLRIPEPFTTAELRAWLEQHEPATFKAMGKSTLSVILLSLRQVMVIEDGPEKDGRETWRLTASTRAERERA